ncbi:Serine/threonine-protein kinase hal4 [Erysiphe neolycopersici]|uniref:non-specific serine/threonine protein kinase n=1 Tax=Erysiphe neolycopersici TaxID=212602 RepID=A0A420HGF5_9PEZI|nr:Serine/threonine-protein kinase hal4 [Erysiphe neolycopersici]
MSAWTSIPIFRRFSVLTCEMAFINSPRDSSNAITQSNKSQESRQALSILSSKQESSLSPNSITVFSTENIGNNGLITPPSETHTKTSRNSSPQPYEKTSMTKRISRMFSLKDSAKSHIALTTSTSSSGQNSPHNDETPPLLQSPKPLSHKTPSLPSSLRDKKVPNAVPQRFSMNANLVGGHQHYLKSARRQEKLSDMLRNVISGKGVKNEPIQEGEQQLSLMSNWVDQLKSERESLGSDKKSSVNSAATLVQKYGKCQEIVGQGAFGIVRISHKRTEGMGEQLYAVKEFRRRPDETEKKYSKRLTSEFCISSSLRHPNVIHTLDLLQDSKGDYCEVMEYCAGGDLYSLVLSTGKLEVAEADCYFKQMMRGVEYMHEMGVAHRDLKPENLLLTTFGSLKITDFGNGECFRMAWESDAHMVTGLCGSAPYIAPEEYTDKEFDARAVDVWATGVIYMAMRTGRHLWRVAKKEDDEFYERYLQGRCDEEGYAPIEALHRARCRNVIYSILDPNPSRRITASQVLKSEWGREIKLCRAGEEGL